MKMRIIQWITHIMQRKKTLMQLTTMFLMYQFIHKHCFPSMREIDMGILVLFTTSIFRPHESICATYLWTEENTCSIMESEAYDMEGNNMWFKQGKFPINLQAESQGELMDGTNIKVTTLIDTGCSKPILNKTFYDKHPYLHEMPHYSIQSIGVVVADDGVINVTEAIQFMN